MIIGCPACKPETFYRTGPRRSEAHFAVRLGDRVEPAAVTLWGQPCPTVIEMVAGTGGWAIRLSPPPSHACGCGSGEPELVMDRSDGYAISVRRKAEIHDDPKVKRPARA